MVVPGRVHSDLQQQFGILTPEEGESAASAAGA